VADAASLIFVAGVKIMAKSPIAAVVDIVADTTSMPIDPPVFCIGARSVALNRRLACSSAGAEVVVTSGRHYY